MSEPRVCMVLESFHPVIGGGETHAKSLAEGLTARGAETLVLTLLSRPGLLEHERIGGYEIHRVPGNRWRAIGVVLRKLHELRERYDLIYVSGFRALGAPLVLASHARRKPVVLQALNNGEFSGAYFDPGLRRWGLTHRSWAVRPLNALRRSALRRAERFVAVSESIRRELVEGGVPPDKLSLIPFGVNLARFHPSSTDERLALRRALGLPMEARVVCFTGRLVTWKGPLTLLAAWAGVIESRKNGGSPCDLLLFLGAGGTDQHNCEAEARRLQRELGLQASTRFLGDVGNVQDYLRAADLFALPTEDDLFPLAMLEALACGLPAVTTLVGGLRDCVAPEENSLVVAPGDVRELREALLRLLSDGELRARLGHAAARTGSTFSEEIVVERHLELFREVVRRAD